MFSPCVSPSVSGKDWSGAETACQCFRRFPDFQEQSTSFSLGEQRLAAFLGRGYALPPPPLPTHLGHWGFIKVSTVTCKKVIFREIRMPLVRGRTQFHGNQGRGFKCSGGGALSPSPGHGFVFPGSAAPHLAPDSAPTWIVCCPVSRGAICPPVWSCGPPWVGLASSSMVKFMLSWFVCIKNHRCFGSIFDPPQVALGQVFQTRRGGVTGVGAAKEELPGWEGNKGSGQTRGEGQEAQQGGDFRQSPGPCLILWGGGLSPPCTGEEGPVQAL